MARSRSIGSIYAELTLKDKMSASIKSARASLNSFAGTAMKATGGAVAAGFAGIGYSIAKAVDAGGELNDMMARTGAAGEGLYVMQRAFENAGLAAGDVPAVLNKMQKSLATGSDAFGELGLSVDALKAKDPTAAFEDIASAIASIADPAARTKAAMDIFGKSGGSLLAVLTDGGAFEQARTQVGSLGKTLADNASQLDAVGDAFGALETKALQVGASIAVGFLPKVTELADKLNQTDLSEFGNNLGVVAGNLADVGEGLMKIIRLTPAFQLGNALQGTNIDPAAAKKIIDAQRAESDALYQSSRQAITAGTGSLASPDFQKAMDSWMTKYVKSFTKKAEEWTAPDVGVPFFLENPSTTTTDIPDFLRRRDQQAAPWESTSYSVNDFQSRGLALSGGYSEKTDKSTLLLGEIKDVLKSIEKKKANEYIYP